MSKLKNIKHGFDKITSNHSQSWSLVLFWIILFEVSATLVEYHFIHKKPQIMYALPDGLYTEILIGFIVTFYLWMCVYNLIFWNKSSILYLVLIGFIGIYLIDTHDFSFDLFFHNINPLMMIENEFGANFIIQFLFKLIIFYLIYQLILSLKISNKN